MHDMKKAGSPICYIEIPAPDLKQATEFYARVFGWPIHMKAPARYAHWGTESDFGGFNPDLRPGGVGAVLYLKVDDIPSKLAEIETAGGKKVTDKTALPENQGFYACFDDPNGVRIGLWSKT